MSFVSYAQNYEDVMLWRALRHVENGFYIDVGAWSPDLDSVTRAFSESGWRGINIEPNPHYFDQLVARRPTDINLKIAVGDHIGVVTMNFISDSGLSTADESFAREYRAKGLDLNEESVELSTLSAICAEHVPQGSDIHFLKVDVEGFERAVLEGNDWNRFRPWILVIEATLPNSQIECHEEWEGLITSAGYLFAYADGLNRYYVAQEHHDLVNAFKFPPNVFDQFITANLSSTLQKLEQSEAALSSARLQTDAEHKKLGQAEAELRSATQRAEAGEHRAAELQRRLESEERLLQESQKRVEDLEQRMIVGRQREQDLATEANQRAAFAAQRYEAILQQNEAILKSTSWRLTAPLRGFAVHIPKVLRGRSH